MLRNMAKSVYDNVALLKLVLDFLAVPPLTITIYKVIDQANWLDDVDAPDPLWQVQLKQHEDLGKHLCDAMNDFILDRATEDPEYLERHGIQYLHDLEKLGFVSYCRVCQKSLLIIQSVLMMLLFGGSSTTWDYLYMIARSSTC